MEDLDWFNFARWQDYAESSWRLSVGLLLLTLIIWQIMRRLRHSEQRFREIEHETVKESRRDTVQLEKRPPTLLGPPTHNPLAQKQPSSTSVRRVVFQIAEEDSIPIPSCYLPVTASHGEQASYKYMDKFSEINTDTYVDVLSRPFLKPRIGKPSINKPADEPKEEDTPPIGMDAVRSSELLRRDREEKERELQKIQAKLLEEERREQARLKKEAQEAEERIRKQKEAQDRARRQKQEADRAEQQRRQKELQKARQEEQQRNAKIRADAEAEEARQKEAREADEAKRQKKIEEERIEAQRVRKQKEDEAASARAAEAARRTEQQTERIRNGSAADLLESYMVYAESIKAEVDIDSPVNSIQDCRKNVKDILTYTESLLNTFDRHDSRQENTFMVRLWELLIMMVFRSARKEGIEEIPPTALDAEVYKNSINAYVLIINLIRVKGLERVWAYFVGKTLRLLEFIYKRDRPIRSIEELDLVVNRYLNFRPDFERVYVSRLDQLTYFLFGLLAYDPYTCFMEILERGKKPEQGMRNDLDSIRSEVESLRRPWNYSPLFILVECIRKTPFTHFKPVCYNNLFSVLYPQYRLAFITNNIKSSPFCVLFRELLADSARFSQEADRSEELKMLLDTDIEDKFAGEEFYDRVEPLAKRIHAAKRRLISNTDINKFMKEGCSLYYFEPSEPTL